MTAMIYHMCSAAGWTAARRDGVYRGTAQDCADGFIHFSTAAQIAESARKHRAGEAGLVLVAVAPESLGDGLRWEPARGGMPFPHLYGTLDPARAASVRPLPLGPDGLHIFPPLD